MLGYPNIWRLRIYKLFSHFKGPISDAVFLPPLAGQWTVLPAASATLERISGVHPPGSLAIGSSHSPDTCTGGRNRPPPKTVPSYGSVYDRRRERGCWRTDPAGSFAGRWLQDHRWICAYRYIHRQGISFLPVKDPLTAGCSQNDGLDQGVFYIRCDLNHCTARTDDNRCVIGRAMAGNRNRCNHCSLRYLRGNRACISLIRRFSIANFLIFASQ